MDSDEDHEIIDVNDSFDPDDVFGDEPQNTKEHVLENEIQELLVDRVDEFRKEIFNSSEAEMQQALLRLQEFNTWQEASAYIQKDIFKKNDVDLLSGATVDFTDRMHRFFNERTHS